MPRPLYPTHTTALIIEDNRDDAAIMARALQTFGVKKWSTVQTAEDALAFLKRHPCDVALVDYRLPGMNGLQLLERIRESWPDILPIVVTGERDERVAVAAMKLGAADYIVKDDILTGAIIRALQAALKGRATSREEDHRMALSCGENRIQMASEEVGWMLGSFASGSELYGYRLPAVIAPEYGAEAWPDALDAFSRYLSESFAQFPELPVNEEENLVRIFLKRGSSPREVMMVYRAVLRSLLCEPTGAGEEPPFAPTVCLAWILARLVDEYQRQLSAIEGKEEAA
jgi:ActR/RegA family two-component response regulator